MTDTILNNFLDSLVRRYFMVVGILGGDGMLPMPNPMSEVAFELIAAESFSNQETQA